MNISHSDNKIVYEFILQGYENQKFRNILQNLLPPALHQSFLGYKKVTNTITIAGGKEKLSDRLNMLPVFLVFNSSLMGLFIIAAYIFMDKDEGTIKAL